MTTATATTDALISALAPGARLLIDQAVVMEEEGTIVASAMLKALDVLTQASRLQLSSTVPKLLSKYGVIPPPGGLPSLNIKVFPRTSLNMIKVLRMSA